LLTASTVLLMIGHRQWLPRLHVVYSKNASFTKKIARPQVSSRFWR